MDIAISNLSDKLLTALEQYSSKNKIENESLRKLLIDAPQQQKSTSGSAVTMEKDNNLRDAINAVVEKNVNKLRNDFSESQDKYVNKIETLEKSISELQSNVSKILQLLGSNKKEDSISSAITTTTA